MLGVITGFAIILAVIFVGWLLAQRGVIGSDRERLMFNRVAFYAATPALLFDSISSSEPQTIFSPVPGVIVAATALISAIFCVAFRRRGVPAMAIGAASSSYFNSVNIGLPVSLYVIGDATYVVPLVFFQMAILSPIILGALGGNSVWGAAKTGLFSPVVVASILGIIVAWQGWTIPEPVIEPIALLGGASIPMVLMSFGASLKTSGVLADAAARPAILAATGLKLVGMPLAAYGIGSAVGLSEDHLYATVILAALPTAQNVYNFAATYERGQSIARDTVFITTFASLPVMLAIAFLFGR